MKLQMFKKYNKIVDLDFFDDYSEKKLLLRQFKRDNGYLDVSDSYIENRMMKRFMEFVNKKKFSKKIGNNSNV